jgi:hypothetical protein
VDYLGLVQAAHEDATGTGAPIDYAHLAHLTSDPDHSSDDSGENSGEDSGGGEGDDWQARR